MIDLGISTVFILGYCMAAYIARRMVNNAPHSKDIVKVLANEAIAAAELCACCFELMIGKP